MKTITKEIYFCEYCNKLYQRKKACELHEAGCYFNPENKRACLDCIHLQKKQFSVYTDTYCGDMGRNVELLYCSKLNTFLYPPKVEAKKNWFETDPDENNPMPKECEFKSSNNLNEL